MRRDLSRLSPLSNLFIHHPYSQSSKASNPRLPRWRTDREADRRAGCKSVHKMFNTLSMTTRFTFTKFQKWYQHEDAKQWVISASRICDSYKNVEMHQLENGTESATCPILQMLWNKLGLGLTSHLESTTKFSLGCFSSFLIKVQFYIYNFNPSRKVAFYFIENVLIHIVFSYLQFMKTEI